MCRSTTENGDPPFFPKDYNQLRIRSFHLLLSIPTTRRHHFSDTLTLIYLPRINATPLEINGAKIPPNTPAFVVLHRIRSAETAGESEATFASTDRVRAGDGLSFEIYVNAEKALKGIFRRGVGWVLECAAIGVAEAEVIVVTDRGVLMRERVQMKAARRRRKRFCLKLQEIPEEGDEEDEKWDMGVSDGWDCAERKEINGVDEVEFEGVSWTADVGIWVVCLAVGLLVSRVSSKRFGILNLL